MERTYVDAWRRRWRAEREEAQRLAERANRLAREMGALAMEVRAFRHRYRNLYMFDLRWEPMRTLLDRAESFWPKLEAELEGFAAQLDDLARSDA